MNIGERPIHWNKTACLINEKYNFKYNFKLHNVFRPKPSILDTDNYLLLVGLPVPWMFLCKESQIPNPTKERVNILLSREHSCLSTHQVQDCIFPRAETTIFSSKRSDWISIRRPFHIYPMCWYQETQWFWLSKIYEDKEELTEHTPVNPMPFKEFEEIILNNVIYVYQNRFALPNTEIKN